MSDKPVLRYDGSTDELVPVTQEWVDEMQSVVHQLSKFRADVRKMAEQPLVLKVPL